VTERERVDPDPFAQTPRRSDDPDPFAETPLDPDDRRVMLAKLAEHMRPRLSSATNEEKELLRQQWDQLRDQPTVESFRTCADGLLIALDEAGAGGSPSPALPDALGFLKGPPQGRLDKNVDWSRSVLSDLPPADWGSDS